MSAGVSDPFSVDPLTGLPRREFLQAHLADACDKARRLGKPLSLLALDLDNFKAINVAYLLSGGDTVLAEVARRLSSLTRSGDVVVRDGGDQFSVVLFSADFDEACREAERIRAAIAAAPFTIQLDHGAAEIRVTASIGVATLAADDIEPWELFRRARKSVHQAKDSGRNRVA